MGELGGMSGLRRAAILMVMVGEETASKVYRNLNEDDLQALTQEIAEIGNISPEHGSKVLEQFHALSVTGEYIARGGSNYAEKLLVKAFGDHQAKALMEQVVRAKEMSASKLDSLRKADPPQLAKFLEGEHPQTIALILAHLTPKQASVVLMRLPEDTRAQSVKRLAQLRQFSPDMATKVSQVLHQKMQSFGEQSRRAYAGVKGVADLLNNMDPASGKVILEAIEQDDPRLAMSIRNLMFTFEDLLGVPEQTIRELLAQLDKKTLGTALKGAPEQLRDQIFKCMSSRAVQMMQEDMDVMGPVRGREIAKAQQECVAVARKLEAEGKIQLKPEGEDELVV